MRLPESQGYNVIFMMVDWFSKLVHMVPNVGTATSLETAKHLSMYGGGTMGCQE